MRATRAKPRSRQRQGRPLFTMTRPTMGCGGFARTHPLMCDLIALAFQTDKTRIAVAHFGPRSIFLYTRSWTCAKPIMAPPTTTPRKVMSASPRFHLGQFAYLAAAGSDAGRRRHRADNSCLMFSPTCSPAPSTTTRKCRWSRRRPRRHAPNRTIPRLSGGRRRQPQVVQSLPGDHGPHGGAARSFRDADSRLATLVIPVRRFQAVSGLPARG